MLRSNEILPLPAKSTICRYLRSSNTGCGFDSRFFELFKKELELFGSKMAYYGMISFDEMSVRSSIEVDMKTMTFSGIQDYGNEHERNSKNIKDQVDHALVFMFSCLYFNFHQSIAMFGSKSTTPGNVLAALFLQAIFELEKAGAKVLGFVCDGNSTNRKMWGEFGISGEMNNCQFRFENPVDESRFIYAFSDAPHLIKCIRNRLLEGKTFKVKNGEIYIFKYIFSIHS